MVRATLALAAVALVLVAAPPEIPAAPTPAPAAAPPALPLGLTMFAREPVAADPKDDPARKAAKDRYNAAVAGLKVFAARLDAGVEILTGAADPAWRLTRAGLDLFDAPADRAALLADHVAVLTEVERVVQRRVDAGIGRAADLAHAREQRENAETLLKAAIAAADGVKK